jgi:hypothetical protein
MFGLNVKCLGVKSGSLRGLPSEGDPMIHLVCMQNHREAQIRRLRATNGYPKNGACSSLLRLAYRADASL